MSYKALIESSVELAFKTVQDLAEDVVLIQRDSSSFDFATKATVKTSAVQTTIKCVVVNSKKKEKESNSVKKTLMFKSSDLADITLYDTVLLNGITWKMAQPQNDNGYVTILEIYRGV
jgi:hypothetical protein